MGGPPGAQGAEAGHPTRWGVARYANGTRVLEPDMPERDAAARGYSVERFAAFADNRGDNGSLYEVTGDHLFLEELNGSDIVQVRLDSDRNPFITMEEGDTIRRPFQRFWVRSNSRNLFVDTINPVEAKFICSLGPVIYKAPKKYGMRGGMFSTGGTATDAGVDAFANIPSQYPSIGNSRVAVMKFGGTVIIDNRDTANDLFFYFGIPGSFSSGGGAFADEFTASRVPANRIQAYIFENRIQNLHHKYPLPGGSFADGVTLILACSTGLTADYVLTLSRFVIDYTDPESALDIAAPPGMRD